MSFEELALVVLGVYAFLVWLVMRGAGDGPTAKADFESDAYRRRRASWR